MTDSQRFVVRCAVYAYADHFATLQPLCDTMRDIETLYCAGDIMDHLAYFYGFDVYTIHNLVLKGINMLVMPID